MSDVNSPLNLQNLLTKAQLPALPQSAIRLLQLSQNPDNGPAEYALPIESDPGLTIQVLRFVNSSYFGFSQKVSSVKLAITLVGIRTIRNFSLWSAVFSVISNPKCGSLDLKSLWQDSLRRALFARRFGKLMKAKEVEELFASALLQDMAVPLLAKELPQQYANLFQQRDLTNRRLSDLEQETFGWNHADAAAMIAKKWSLPERFAELVQSHIQPADQMLKPGAEVGAVAVALSSLLPSVCEETWTDANAFMLIYQGLGAARQPLETLLGEVDAEFCEFAPLLQLATPARSLVERFSDLVAKSVPR